MGGGGACSRYGGHERCIQNLVGKPEVKRPFEKLRRRWKVIIQMDLSKCCVRVWSEFI
jgi:GTP:adenosylcobinamide-phosphate guanylyltransferase